MPNVSTEVSLMLIVPQQARVPVTAALSYTTTDPYAVSLAFDVGLEVPVTWIFARDLLSFRAPCLGDVRVWESERPHGPAFGIKVSSPFGDAHFETSAKEISDFARQTFALVPEGTESDYIDWDVELAVFRDTA